MTTQEKLRAEEIIEAKIEELSKDADIVKVVKDIEGGFKTTQNHYGKYLSLLTPYADAKYSAVFHIFSKALIRAGANSSGVSSAIQILKGN